MNCPRCDYLLWELSETRCPECASEFEVTDFAFPPGGVHFLCNRCGQPYLGTDDDGLPHPRRFTCVRCRADVEAGRMIVRPVGPSARGEPLRFGTPWEHRYRVGFLRAFLDGVGRLATQPGEYFRSCYANDTFGAAVFSIICAYAAAAVFLIVASVLHAAGVFRAPFVLGLSPQPRHVFVLLVLIPYVVTLWNYGYGCLIQGVLHCMGQRKVDLDRSVHAVAFASAVLPVLLLLPPVGLLWYVAVVSSGVENLLHTSRPRALVAALLPLLLAGNVVFAVGFTLL